MFEKVVDRIRAPRLQIPINLIDERISKSISYSDLPSKKIYEDTFMYRSNPKKIPRITVPGYVLDRFGLTNYRYFEDDFLLQCLQYRNSEGIDVLGPKEESSSIVLSFDLFGEPLAIVYMIQKDIPNSNIVAQLQMSNLDNSILKKQPKVSLDEAKYLLSILDTLV